MPKVVREDIDALNAVLTVTIEREDYEQDFKNELIKLKDRAAMKGFRKGKTPIGFLKKMYGKGLLSELISDMLQKQLGEVMSDEKITFMGQPIPMEGQKAVKFDYDSTEPYSFQFELGKAPEFELAGLDKNTSYDFFKVAVSDETVMERLEMARKQTGEQAATTEPIAAGDMINFSAVELDGDAPKADGWKTTFSVLFDKLAEGPTKEALLGKQKGHSAKFNIFELEEGASREFVKKYLLNFTQADLDEGTETGEMYEGTVESVTRQAPAELTQEFYDKVFGPGEVSDLESAKARIAESLSGAQQGQADSMLYRELRTRLIEMNRAAMPLPSEFIKRWLKVSQEKDVDRILNNFDGFSDDMRWSLIKDKLFKQFDIQVEEEEIKEMAYNRVASYFGGYGDSAMLEPVVKRMLEDQETVNGIANEVLGDKLFRKMKESVKLNEVSTSSEDLKAKYDAVIADEEAKSKQRQLASATEEEE